MAIATSTIIAAAAAVASAASTAVAVKSLTAGKPAAPKSPDIITPATPQVSQAVSDERRRRQSARGYQATILSELVESGTSSPGTKQTLGS